MLKDIEQQFGKNSTYIQELSELSLLLVEIEEFQEAEINFNTCLEHFRIQRDRLGQAAALGLLATLFFKKQDYKESIKYYNESYGIYNELNQIPEVIMCLMGIGNSLIKLELLDDACDTFLECSAICSDNDDIFGILDCLGNLVQIHETLERWDVVYELYQKTLEAFIQLKDFQGIVITNFNLGILERRNQNYNEALLYFKEGTNHAIDINYAELIIKGLSYIGETLFYLGRMRDAKNEYIKALSLAENVKAQNAIYQLRVLLQALGLKDKDIERELQEYRNRKRDNNP